MKFNFKTIVAATLLAGSANVALADIVSSGIPDGSYELVFRAFDGDDNGYTFDLGINSNLLMGASGFGQTPATTAGLAQAAVSGLTGTIYDAPLLNFNPGSFTDINAVEWNLSGVDNFAGFRALTTADVNLGSVGSVTDTQVQNIANNSVLQIDAVNGFMALDDDAHFNDATGGAEKASAAGGATFGGNSFDTTNLFGVQSELYYLTQAANGANNPGFSSVLENALGGKIVADTYEANGTWNLRIQALAAPVTAVPEPSTYAMMLAGLALLGGAARRRNKQA